MSDDLWSIISLAALFGWISASVAFIFKVFPERNRFDARAARLWGSAVLVLYAVWVVGLLNA